MYFSLTSCCHLRSNIDYEMETALDFANLCKATIIMEIQL